MNLIRLTGPSSNSFPSPMTFSLTHISWHAINVGRSVLSMDKCVRGRLLKTMLNFFADTLFRHLVNALHLINVPKKLIWKQIYLCSNMFILKLCDQIYLPEQIVVFSIAFPIYQGNQLWLIVGRETCHPIFTDGEILATFVNFVKTGFAKK